MKPLKDETIQTVLQDLETMKDVSEEQIKQTAARLDAKNYQPMLLTDTPNFLNMTSDELAAHIQELVSARRDELTEQHLNLLIYHFRLLQRLRRDEPEAWDEVNELMEDD